MRMGLKGPTEVCMRAILHGHSEHCMCWMSVHLAKEEKMLSLVHIRVSYLPSIKALIKQTYRFQLIQRAHSTCSHVIELHSDFPFWGDACHCAFSKLIVNYLSSQSQATVYATNHSQDCHQSSNLWILSVREVVIQHSLTKNNEI